MTRLDEKERAISRERVTYLVEHLPPLVEVPTPPSVRNAQWFREAKLEGRIKVRALPCGQIEKFSGKLMAARGNCDRFEAQGVFKEWTILIVPTSGNFGKDVAGIASGYKIQEVWAVVNSKTPQGKLLQLEAAGAVVWIAPEGKTAVEYAYELAYERGGVVMDQYIEEGSVLGHKYTMNHIASEMQRLEPESGFIAGGITGSCSSLLAMRRYLPSLGGPPVKIMGVASMSKEEKVPASRSPEDLEELRKVNGVSGFMFRPEWEGVLNFPLITSVTRKQAYRMNGELFRYHFSVGPTGALLTAGFYDLVRCHAERGELRKLRNEHGQILAVLLWMDSYSAYDDREYRSFLVG